LTQDAFVVWLVRFDSSSAHRIEPFYGGVVNDPFGKGVLGIFLTEAEAEQYGTALTASLGRFALKAPERPYAEAIAWLVTFIILMHETGEAKLHVEPSFGGACIWNDDRDVMAIFQTRAEAEQYVADRSNR
jgi:hypothetical protein